MQEKFRPVLIGSLFVVVVAIGMMTLWMKTQQSRVKVTWGGPTLRVSERDYFTAQTTWLLQSWNPQGQLRGFPYESAKNGPMLAVDLEHGVLWLEPAEQAEYPDAVWLPAALSWKLYFRSRDDLVELPPFVCLNPSPRWRSPVVLVGTGQDDMHLACVLHGITQGATTMGEGPFDPNSLPGFGDAGELSSLMITDEQRLSDIRQHRPATTMATESLLPDDDLEPAVRNRVMWQRLQKPLYQALEQQVTDLGHSLGRISVAPGPDYTAGLAGISLEDPPQGGFWNFLFRRRGAFGRRYGILAVEMEGDGSWHCRSASKTGNGSVRSGNALQSRGMPTLDFHVKSQTVPSHLVPERQDPQLPEPRWSVTLDDGTRVELIGICCDQGATWWAPDGSKLEDWPGYLGTQNRSPGIMHDLISSRSGRSLMGQLRRFPSTEDDARCMLLLRVPSLTGFGNSSGSSGSGTTSLCYGQSSPLLDRFGQSIFPGQYISIKFDSNKDKAATHGLGLYVLGNPEERPGILRQDRSRGGGMIGGGVGAGPSGRAGGMIPSTAMTRGTDIDDLELQWIRLENLSLQADQQTAFKMILTEEAKDLPSASRVQVQP